MRLLASILALLALIGALWGVYALGQSSGKAGCEAAHAMADVGVLQKQAADAQKAVTRAAKTGAAQERQRAAIDTTFTAIAKEQDHAPADPVDACVLPDARLRLWAGANAGDTGEGAAPGQPIGAAQAAAAPGLGPDAGPGSQPHAGGAGLPPAGAADVQPAELPGDQP